MTEASADKALWAQIERLRDGQNQIAHDQAKLAAVVDALRDRVEREGKAHEEALARHLVLLDEIFKRLGVTETGMAVTKSRWALVGGVILVICSAVTALITTVAGKLWP